MVCNFRYPETSLLSCNKWGLIWQIDNCSKCHHIMLNAINCSSYFYCLETIDNLDSKIKPHIEYNGNILKSLFWKANRNLSNDLRPK